MLTSFIIALPCATCLLWASLYLVKKNRNTAEQIILALALCGGTYLFAEYNALQSHPDYHSWIVSDMLSHYAQPMIAPLILALMVNQTHQHWSRWWLISSLCFAVLIGTVSLSIYSIIGMDDAVEYLSSKDKEGNMPAQYMLRIFYLYEHICVKLNQTIIFIFSLFSTIIIFCLFNKTHIQTKELCAFFFHKGELEPIYLEGILFIFLFLSIIAKIIIGRNNLITFPLLATSFCLVRTIIIFFIGNISLYNRHPTIHLSDLGNLSIINHQSSITHHQSSIVPPPSIPTFPKIKEDKLFLNPHITIEEASAHLSTNRTYLSQYISSIYHCSFREYINYLRIEYSKSYMLSHPNDIQEVIAESSGFPDAPSFNKKFKSITGQSPRIWLLSHS